MTGLLENLAYSYHSGNLDYERCYSTGYGIELELFDRSRNVDGNELKAYGILHKHSIMNTNTQVNRPYWILERDSTVDLEFISIIESDIDYLIHRTTDLLKDLNSINIVGDYKSAYKQTGIHLNISKKIFHNFIPDYFIGKFTKFIHNNQALFMVISGRAVEEIDEMNLYEYNDEDGNPFHWCKFHKSFSLSDYMNGSYSFIEIKSDRIELRLMGNDNDTDSIRKRILIIDELIRYFKFNDSILLSDFLIYLDEKGKNELYDYIIEAGKESNEIQKLINEY